MSLRAALMRLGVRWFMKPTNRPRRHDRGTTAV